MKGIRIELLGIGIILLGIALSTNNFWAYTLGVVGFGIISMGCFWKEKTTSSQFIDEQKEE